MRILLIGDTSGYLDEGMKNTTYNLSRILALHHKVWVASPKSMVSPAALLRVIRFQPDIVHYIHGPTIRSFLLAKVLAIMNRRSVTVMSAPRPWLSKLSERLVPFLKPDLILVQSSRERERFMRLGCTVSSLPGGVSLEKFSPVSLEQKQALRRRYGFQESKSLILHVGQITADRGVSLLGQIKQRLGDAGDVLIVGASTIRPQMDIVEDLQNKGCVAHLGHVERIQEYYQMADCYVFPGLGESPAIEIPLTVLEALACNLPVVTSPFGGLPELFKEHGEGLSFAATVDEFVAEVQKYLVRSQGSICTRRMVEAFGWPAIADRLLAYYEELVTRGR